MNILERLMLRREITADGCWEWTGSRNRKGYGRMHVAGVGTRSVHRVAWESLRGPIPEATPEMDHLCRNTSCFNPDHLEPVTRAENVRRAWGAREVCSKGLHDLTLPGAVQVYGVTGWRTCRECKRSVWSRGPEDRKHSRVATEAKS